MSTRQQLSEGVLQYELFSERVCEVESEGVRYILRRNPRRAEEIKSNREGKLATLRQLTVKQTEYLAEHSRAVAAVAERQVPEATFL